MAGRYHDLVAAYLQSGNVESAIECLIWCIVLCPDNKDYPHELSRAVRLLRRTKLNHTVPVSFADLIALDRPAEAKPTEPDQASNDECTEQIIPGEKLKIVHARAKLSDDQVLPPSPLS